MTFLEIQKEKLTAMKNGDKTRVKVLNDIIVLVQKECVKGKTKIEPTDEMVAQCAVKVQKTLEEMVATCPGKTAQKDYTPLLEEYQAQLAIAKEYAPQMITDPVEIQCLVLGALENSGNAVSMEKKNKGQVMKIVMPVLKGKVDMAIANQVIGELLV